MKARKLIQSRLMLANGQCDAGIKVTCVILVQFG